MTKAQFYTIEVFNSDAPAEDWRARYLSKSALREIVWKPKGVVRIIRASDDCPQGRERFSPAELELLETTIQYIAGRASVIAKSNVRGSRLLSRRAAALRKLLGKGE